MRAAPECSRNASSAATPKWKPQPRGDSAKFDTASDRSDHVIACSSGDVAQAIGRAIEWIESVESIPGPSPLCTQTVSPSTMAASGMNEKEVRNDLKMSGKPG
jgi:hypothetical protein